MSGEYCILCEYMLGILAAIYSLELQLGLMSLVLLCITFRIYGNIFHHS